jgi:hypothetical protein
MTMTPLDDDRGREPVGRGNRLAPAWLAAIALAAAALPAQAQNNAGGGSESVGSLPAMSSSGPGTGELTLSRMPVRVVLQGRQDELRAVLLQTRLSGQVHEPVWTALSVPGMAQVSFEGPFELTLDRRALEQSFVTAKIEFGAPLYGGAVHLTAGGRRSDRAITSRQLDLHLQQLSWSGLLDQGVVLQVMSPTKQSSRVSISAEGGKILLTQQAKAVPGK